MPSDWWSLLPNADLNPIALGALIRDIAPGTVSLNEGEHGAVRVVGDGVAVSLDQAMGLGLASGLVS